MPDLISEIWKVEPGQIGDVVDAALGRYQALYPQWEVTTISIDKRQSRSAQIDRMIAFLEKMKGME